MSTEPRVVVAKEPTSALEEKQVALSYLHEAWTEARLEGVDGRRPRRGQTPGPRAAPAPKDRPKIRPPVATPPTPPAPQAPPTIKAARAPPPGKPATPPPSPLARASAAPEIFYDLQRLPA